MRILMVSDVYFPRVNGVSTSIATYSDSLRNLGHDVVLIAPEYLQEQRSEPDICRVPARDVLFDPEDRMMRYSRILDLEDVLRASKPDIVHIQTPFVAHYAGRRLARRLGVPTVESYHTYFEEYLYHYVPFLPRSVLRAAARNLSARQGNSVDALVVPSRAMRDKLADYGVSTPMEVIPTGLNLSQFGNGDGRRFRCLMGIDDHRPVLLYVGRLAHEKNIDFLLHMVVQLRRHLSELMIVIAGEGPAETHLRRLAVKLGIEDNVTFVGYLDRDSALLDCYAAANVFVFSSRTETQGLVLLEAMAMGVPVVALAAMGTRDVLRDGAGCLVAGDDIDDFASKVLYLLLHRETRRELSRRAREYAQSWSNEACADRLVNLYDRVAKIHRIGGLVGSEVPSQ